jgi:hypothetical protein
LTTAAQMPPLPDAIARYFADIVKFTTTKAHRRWGHIFEFQDLEQEAWILASQRFQGWSDQKAMARKDLTFALDRWINQRLPELGYRYRRQPDGRRRWVPTQATLPFDPQMNSMEKYSVPWDSTPEADEDCELSSSPDWAPMGRRKRERYARILFQRYPVLVAEFEAVENQVKPAKLSHDVWKRRQERTRAGLRVKYATELATARYAVEGFGVEAVAA